MNNKQRETKMKLDLTIIHKDPSPSEGVQQAIVQFVGQHYLVSSSTRMTSDETLVFKCNSKGVVSDWLECGGGTCLTLEDVLSDFDNFLYRHGYAGS